jgi:hypothetical protein
LWGEEQSADALSRRSNEIAVVSSGKVFTAEFAEDKQAVETLEGYLAAPPKPGKFIAWAARMLRCRYAICRRLTFHGF